MKGGWDPLECSFSQFAARNVQEFLKTADQETILAISEKVIKEMRMDHSVATLYMVELRVGGHLVVRVPEATTSYQGLGEAKRAWMDSFPEDEDKPVTITRVKETR